MRIYLFVLLLISVCIDHVREKLEAMYDYYYGMVLTILPAKGSVDSAETVTTSPAPEMHRLKKQPNAENLAAVTALLE